MWLNVVWSFPWLLLTVNVFQYSVHKDRKGDLMCYYRQSRLALGKAPVSLKHIMQLASFEYLGWLLLSLSGTNPK